MLSRLGQELRVALVGVGQGKFQRLGLAAGNIENLAAKADGFVILDACWGQVELPGDPAGEVTDAWEARATTLLSFFPRFDWGRSAMTRLSLYETRF